MREQRHVGVGAGVFKDICCACADKCGRQPREVLEI